MQRTRKELHKILGLLYDRFYLVGTEGNVSVRISEDRILTTPAGSNKGLLAPEDLVLTRLDGTPIGSGRPSSELAMHLEVYSQRPEVRAVVHAHPRNATAFACAGRELDSCLMTESVVGIGRVPLAPLARPSTLEVPESIRPLVSKTSTILLASHGVLTYGESLLEAYNLMEGVEQFAAVQLKVLALGGGKIPPERVEELIRLRSRYGLTAPILACRP